MSDSLKRWTVSWLTLDCLWTTKRSRRPLTTSRFQPLASGERRWLSRLGKRRDLPGLIFLRRLRRLYKCCFLLCFYHKQSLFVSALLPAPTLSLTLSLCLSVCLSASCSFSQRVFCFQGIKAHGSATLSSRRQLSECRCCVHLAGRDCVL